MVPGRVSARGGPVIPTEGTRGPGDPWGSLSPPKPLQENPKTLSLSGVLRRLAPRGSPKRDPAGDPPGPRVPYLTTHRKDTL